MADKASIERQAQLAEVSEKAVRYLLTTIGAASIAKDLYSYKKVLTDLSNMLLGIQDPINGLYLRYNLIYLLPIISTDELCEAFDITVPLLHNFSNATKLFARLEISNQNQDFERKDGHKYSPFVLLSASLLTITIIEPIETVKYTNEFSIELHLATLPFLIHFVNNLRPNIYLRPLICKLFDRLTQYVIEELKNGRRPTIPPVPPSKSSACNKKPGKCVRSVEQKETSSDTFDFVIKQVYHLLYQRIKAHKSDSREGVEMWNYGLSIHDIPLIYSSLLSLVLWQCHLDVNLKNRHDHALTAINQCLQYLVLNSDTLGKNNLAYIPDLPRSVPYMKLMELLFHFPSPWTGYECDTQDKLPDTAFPSIFSVLLLPGFKRCSRLFDIQWYKLLSAAIIRHKIRATSINHLDALMILVKQLLPILPKDSEKGESDGLVSDKDASTYHFLTRLHHIIGPDDRTSDLDHTLIQLIGFRQRLLPKVNRILITTNSVGLVFHAIHLVRAINRCESVASGTRQIKLMHGVNLIRDCIGTLSDAANNATSYLTVLLCFESALAIDPIPFDEKRTLVFELMTKALTLLEDVALSSRDQVRAISSLFSTVGQLRCLTRDKLVEVRSRCLAIASGLSNKVDRSRALAKCASIYWPVPRWSRRRSVLSLRASQLPEVESITDEALSEMRDDNGVVSAINRSTELAFQCTTDTSVRMQLLVENFDAAVVLRVKQCMAITDQLLAEKSAKIKDLIGSLPKSPSSKQIKSHYNSILAFMPVQVENDNR